MRDEEYNIINEKEKQKTRLVIQLIHKKRKSMLECICDGVKV